jgi:hypothetical protein
MNKTSKLLLLITAAVLLPAVSWATIIFTLGNNPQPGEENVLLNQGETGNLVTGLTNQSHTPIEFVSTQTLTIPANGQARIEATSGGSQVALSDIHIGRSSFFDTFTDAIFDMHIGGTIGTSGGTATITAIATNGTSSFTNTLGNGQNFLTVVATGGEVINEIGISYPTGFTDLRQVRISGVGGVSVPDSGATLTLLGASMLAVALLRPAARAKFGKA